MMTRIIAIFAFLLILSAPAAAEEDVGSLFCDKMYDAELYEKNKFESYKMLIGGQDGWIFRTETDLRQDFTLTPEGLDNLRDLNAALKAKGIDLVILLIPTRGLMHSEYLLPEDVKKFNFSVDRAWESYWSLIDALHNEEIAVVGLKRPAPGTNFFYKRDHHWNAAGSKIGAQALAAYIRELPAYEKVEKVSFLPKEGPQSDFYGVSKKVFKKFCDTEQQPEKIIQRYTERADETTAEDALFGEAKSPQIVLLGTSNSTQEPSYANFAGFLKEELSTDILNMSVSGGGLDTAMLSYLNSDYYKNDPAKIAIWEVPSYYDISNHINFFREAIPAIYGACETAAAEAKNVELKEKTTIALSKLADKDISGEEYYLYLKFAKNVTKPFSADLSHLKDRSKYKFTRSTRYPQDKEFYLRLKDDTDSPLDKVILTVPKEILGNTVDVRICKQPDNADVTAATEKREKMAEPNSTGSVINFLNKFKKM